MAVFDELNDNFQRLEDPEERKGEKIQREGEAKNIKRHSSGVSLSTYKRSIAVVYTLIAIFFVGAVGGLGYLAISAFVSR